MAQNVFLKLKTPKMGEILGSVTVRGNEGKINVYAAEHAIDMLTTPSSGVAVGKQLHKPFTITKAIDMSTPKLYTLLDTQELISEWELTFYTPGRSGQSSNHYTVRLDKARVVSIHFHLPDMRVQAPRNFVEMEDVTFSYQKIEITWIPDGITAQLNWSGSG
jgi:type VI secretion system secreted protein Hcp